MHNMSTYVNDSMAVFDNSLIIGNHDTITLFGINAQNDLKDYSRRVTSMLLKNTEEIDIAISDVLEQIEHFENKTKKSKRSIWGQNRNNKEILRDYQTVLAHIEDVTVYFKLQQATLIKDIKLLERLSETLSSCSHELERCIKEGEKVLVERNTYVKDNAQLYIQMSDTPDYSIWFERLQKRIQELKISHTVSLQSQAQIKILHDNNLILFDRIASAISNTFPIWQNQIAIKLGIDIFESKLEKQDSIMNFSGRSVNAFLGEFSKKRKKAFKSDIDINDIAKINQELGLALEELLRLEENDKEFREKLSRITL